MLLHVSKSCVFEAPIPRLFVALHSPEDDLDNEQKSDGIQGYCCRGRSLLEQLFRYRLRRLLLFTAPQQIHPRGFWDTFRHVELEDIKKDSAVSGIDPSHSLRVVITEYVGDATLTVYYKTPAGRLLERMLFSDR